MGLFEQFPYTNFHDLNLDFILRKLKKLEDRMVELDGKMAALEGKMDVLRDEMDQLREAMAALVQLVESFQDTLDSHTHELAALNARCDSLESGLNTLELDVAALTGRMASAESGINALTGRVAMAEVDITALEGRMDSAESDISALRENINDITADVTKLQDILNHAQFIGHEFTQNGTLELIGRTVDKQSSIVFGAIRMKHYIGENDEDIIISVSGEDIAPGNGWGRWIMYRDDSPAGSLEPGSVLSDVIGEGFISASSGSKKKSPDDPRSLALIVKPKHVKSGYAFNLVVPNVIKQAIIDNPTKTFVLQFTYIPQSNIT